MFLLPEFIVGEIVPYGLQVSAIETGRWTTLQHVMSISTANEDDTHSERRRSKRNVNDVQQLQQEGIIYNTLGERTLVAKKAVSTREDLSN